MVHIFHAMLQHQPCQPFQVALMLGQISDVCGLALAVVIIQECWKVAGKFNQPILDVSRHCAAGLPSIQKKNA